MKSEDIHRLYQEGILSSLDFHFATFMGTLSGNDVPEFTLAAALVSKFTEEGHICLDLSSLEGKPLVIAKDGNEWVICPKLSTWRAILEASPVVGAPGDYRPLILDDKARLYLYRYWEYEKKLADVIRSRVDNRVEEIDIPRLREGLDRLFPEGQEPGINWQKVAAITAVMKNVCVISGGPGTGKTTLVTKILSLLVEQAKTDTLRVALVAPTGKAAARLQEAVRNAKKELWCPAEIKEAIPEDAFTIHRLLGTIPYSPYFRHNAEKQLPIDVVVVDEVSMVSLALMSKFSEAVPLTSRMILLGDKDQLASVEAGAVLGDICDTGRGHCFSREYAQTLKRITQGEIAVTTTDEHEPNIQDCIVPLQKSFRFGRDSGIGELSQAVKEGDSGRALTLLKSGKYKDITWSVLPPPNALPGALKDTVKKGFAPYLEASDPEAGLHFFERFRILCVVREGPYGVSAVNLLVEEILKKENLINPGRRWYPGRPIMIVRNDYQLKLFNGDVGIIFPDPEGENELRAFFPAADGTLRKYPPIRLPEHETVYAMTVHKSQGSEFDEALLLLPDRQVPVLTRELVYTGVTRVKRSIEVWGLEAIFQAAVSRRIERATGLREALWERKR